VSAEKRLHLVREVLDARLTDRNGRNIGRVDGLVLDLRDGGPPRLVALESGPVTLMRRIHPAIGRWLRALSRRFSPVPLVSVKFPPSAFRDIGVDIELDVDADHNPKLLRLEKWLSRHVISRIPGGRK
jgi:hypothetical protein